MLNWRAEATRLTKGKEQKPLNSLWNVGEQPASSQMLFLLASLSAFCATFQPETSLYMMEPFFSVIWLAVQFPGLEPRLQVPSWISGLIVEHPS